MCTQHQILLHGYHSIRDERKMKAATSDSHKMHVKEPRVRPTQIKPGIFAYITALLAGQLQQTPALSARDHKRAHPS